MYITVMDFCTETITKLVWDRDKDSVQTEEVECLLEGIGFHLSQIHYMTSDEEPDVGLVEVSDLLSDKNAIKRLRS